jgi:hypothetical protein
MSGRSAPERISSVAVWFEVVVSANLSRNTGSSAQCADPEFNRQYAVWSGEWKRKMHDLEGPL